MGKLSRRDEVAIIFFILAAGLLGSLIWALTSTNLGSDIQSLFGKFKPSTGEEVDYVKCQAMKDTAEDVWAAGGGNALAAQEALKYFSSDEFDGSIPDTVSVIMEKPEFAPTAKKLREIYADMEAAGCP